MFPRKSFCTLQQLHASRTSRRPSLGIAVAFLASALLLLVPVSGFASEEETFTYTWEPEHADPNYHLPQENDFYTHGAAGQIETFEMEYNATQQVLSVDLTLGGVIAPAVLPRLVSFTVRSAPQYNDYLSRVTSLDAGRFATLYFDVSHGGAPKISVYSFAGNEHSYDDLGFYGRHVPSGVCPAGATCQTVRGELYLLPERICTTEGAGNTCGDFVIDSFFSDNGDGTATYRFSVRTEAINAHVPASYNEPLCPPNVFPFCPSWEGMQFDHEVGFLVSALGYSNLDVAYTHSGFISDVDFDGIASIPGVCFPADRTCPRRYQTLICGHDMKTVQPAYCEVLQADSGTLMIGEQFGASLRALSQGGNDLTVFYSGAPSTMQFTPVNGTTEFADPLNRFGQRDHPDYDIFYKAAPIPNEQTSALSYTAVADDAGKQFSVDVSFIESRTNREFVCPVGFSVIDLPECEDLNIRNTQFELDSVSEQQTRLVRRITRQFVRRARGTSVQRVARTFRRQAVARADELNQANWTAIWSIPAVLNLCEPSPLCVQVSNVSALTDYNNNSVELRNLVRQTNRRMNRTLGQRSPRLVRQANRLLEEALAESALVPQSYDVCDIESGPSLL